MRTHKHTQTKQSSQGEEDEGENEKVVLCQEQLEVVSKALQGDNIFITGGAGTGKSLVSRMLS